MIINTSFDFSLKEVKCLKIYRKFLNATRGTSYDNINDMVDTITRRYLDSCIKQIQQKRRDKISKLYRRATEAKQTQVDAILEVTDDD